VEIKQVGCDQNCEALPYTVSVEQVSSPILLTNYFTENERPLRERLYSHGAILFRGFDIVDPDAFRHAAIHIASPLLDYRGGVASRRQLNDSVYNSTDLAPNRALAPHNEKSYSALHPDLVLFCCAIPAETGGATPLVDGRRVWHRLSSELQSEFRTRKITFIQNLPSGTGAGKSWMASFETEDREEVAELLVSIGAHFFWKQDGSLHVEETLCPVKVHPATAAEALFCPADTWYRSASEFGRGRAAADRASDELYQYCRFEDGEEIAPWMIAEISSAIAAEVREFQWRRGDVLLIDNRIVLHARAPFTGNRLILVAMGKDARSGSPMS
jgi:alpha-ketoglutarate-dependent taurine dioxygenase